MVEMDELILNDYYLTVRDLVLKCGEITLNTKLLKEDIEIKSCNVDLVTIVDKKVEETLIDGLSKKYPDHKFIGEESVAGGKPCILTNEPTWIIDPVDGTMNFVHSFPHFCISIALFVNKVPEIGIVYNPTMKQMFTARKGKGAFLNDVKINVSGETELMKALVMTEAGTSRDPDKMNVVLQNYTKMIPLVHGIRTLGSAALNMCMVALGGADANFEFGIHVWDMAAGQIIVEEAGGVCIDTAGGSFDIMSRRVLCASTMELAQAFAAELHQFSPPRD